MDARLCLEELRRCTATLPVLVALRDIYQDPGALILEVTQTAAVCNVAHLCSDVVLLSTQRALVRTAVPPAVWQHALTQGVTDDPDVSVLRLRWRPSRHGGRPWAQPERTAAQLQAVRAQASVRLQGREPGSSILDGDATLSLVGPKGPQPAVLLRAIMSAVSNRLQVPLRERDQDAVMGNGDWMLMPDLRVRVRLVDAAVVRQLAEVVHDSPVSVGGDMLAVQISNPVLLDCQINCSGARRGGTAGPAGNR